jgi:hypothetical protein
MSIYHLIIMHIFVFMSDTFNNRIAHDLSFTEPNLSELILIGSFFHLHP